MADFVASVEEELQAVQRELAALPLFQKYERLRDLVSLYKGQQVAVASVGAGATPSAFANSAAFYSSAAEGAPASRFARNGAPKKINRPINKDREQTLSFAEAALEGRSIPTKTSEIWEIIEPLGAKIGGAEPKSNLSAMLHHAPAFRSHGRKGWTLAKYNISDEQAELDDGDRASREDDPSDNVIKHEAPEDDMNDILG